MIRKEISFISSFYFFNPLLSYWPSGAPGHHVHDALEAREARGLRGGVAGGQFVRETPLPLVAGPIPIVSINIQK